MVEGNQGGDLVRTILHQIDPSVPVVTVHASKSKAARAEPVVMAYRMERVWHVQDFPLLQDELTSWEEGGRWSPNRMDAMVHGLRALLIDDSELLGFGSMRSSMERYREPPLRCRLSELAERVCHWVHGALFPGKISLTF